MTEPTLVDAELLPDGPPSSEGGSARVLYARAPDPRLLWRDFRVGILLGLLVFLVVLAVEYKARQRGLEVVGR